MGTGRQYDEKFKLEAIKLAKEIGAKKAEEELEKANRELKEMNEFLEEASAFFAASRQKYAKRKE